MRSSNSRSMEFAASTLLFLRCSKIRMCSCMKGWSRMRAAQPFTQYIRHPYGCCACTIGMHALRQTRQVHIRIEEDKPTLGQSGHQTLVYVGFRCRFAKQMEGQMRTCCCIILFMERDSHLTLQPLQGLWLISPVNGSKLVRHSKLLQIVAAIFFVHADDSVALCPSRNLHACRRSGGMGTIPDACQRICDSLFSSDDNGVGASRLLHHLQRHCVVFPN